MPRTPATDALKRVLSTIPPASGAVVMGTGIVSIGLSLDHRETLSRILLVIDAAAWIGLRLLLASRALLDRERVHREAPPAALTGIAGTAVLGTRLTLLGWSWAGIALLAIAVVFWLVLLTPVLRNWVTPTVGVSLVLTVSTESLAVLSAALAARERVDWLLDAALLPFLLGLSFYAFVIARFDLRQLATGHGDHWITGGALAISTLAAARITLAAKSLAVLGGAHTAVKDASVVLWALTIAWLPALLAAEALYPRLGYDVRRWSTVFPVGMYAACSFLVGAAAQASGITDFARVWVWAGVAIWLVVFLAMLRRGRQVARGEHPALTPARVDELAPSQHHAHRPPSV